jgi:uncharacterized damage-inducible protein DinB
MDHLRRLIDHLEWADERVLGSLRACRTPLPAAINLYCHILGAEHAWLSRIDGATSSVAIWPEISLDECENLARDNVASLRKILSEVTVSDLGREITYRNSAGAEFTTGLEDILLHVALHGSYHRGQVAALLRSAGDTPNPTDYIQWVRGAPAATRTPE